MNAEQQYIELFSQTEAMICKHSAEVLNAPRAAAFADFERRFIAPPVHTARPRATPSGPSCSRMKSCAWTIRRVWYFSEVKNR